jgi:hypothetical protein
MTAPADYGVRRFVVLRHSGTDEPHSDFLFELDDTSPLITFRIVDWPIRETQSATKLRDHRRFYLSYEGSISGDRGRVDRMAEGQGRVARTRDGWVIEIDSAGLSLLFQPPSHEASDDWQVTPTQSR